MSAVKIGVTAHINKVTEYDVPGYEKIVVNDDYPRSVFEAGAVPMILYPNWDLKFVREQLSAVDGLLLTGGDDLDPALYGEEPEKVKELNPFRDYFEWELVRLAHEMKKPIFGICRGLQLLNVYFGGTLWQDLEGQAKIKHVQDSCPDYPIHSVDIVPGSFLEKATGRTTIRVNSYHHQAVRAVAPGFEVAAKAKDGIIEAIERKGEVFCAAVQWHPELLSRHREEAKNIFKYFISRI